MKAMNSEYTKSVLLKANKMLETKIKMAYKKADKFKLSTSFGEDTYYHILQCIVSKGQKSFENITERKILNMAEKREYATGFENIFKKIAEMK
jgi:hypothetical protein